MELTVSFVPCLVMNQMKRMLLNWNGLSSHRGLQPTKNSKTKSQVHKTATLKATNFMSIMNKEMIPIDQQLSSTLAAQIADNRKKKNSIQL